MHCPPKNPPPPATNYSLTLDPSTPSAPATLRGTAIFPPDFPAFAGHFPGNPILPAFLHIQSALDLLALAKLPCQLLRLESAKFQTPIPPSTPVQITLTPLTPSIYECTLSSDTTVFSTFTLHLVAV